MSIQRGSEYRHNLRENGVSKREETMVLVLVMVLVMVMVLVLVMVLVMVVVIVMVMVMVMVMVIVMVMARVMQKGNCYPLYYTCGTTTPSNDSTFSLEIKALSISQYSIAT